MAFFYAVQPDLARQAKLPPVDYHRVLTRPLADGFAPVG